MNIDQLLSNPVLSISSAVCFGLLILLIFKWRSVNDVRRRFAILEDKYSVLENQHKSLEAAHAGLETRYRDVLDIDQYLEDQNKKLTDVKNSYAEKKQIYDALTQQISIYEDKLEFIDVGIYDPSFEFETSEEFKLKIDAIREQQKEFIRDKKAMFCNAEWTIDGSRTKGKTMTNRQMRLALRAFNNECEAAIANTRWNNIESMRSRINRAVEAIDKMNASNQIYFDDGYVRLKLLELETTHQYKEKKKQERDHAADLRRAEREEQRLLKEQAQAEKEEQNFQKLLDKARKQAEKAVGEELAKLESQIAVLTDDLNEAHEKVERAKSMAEQTKAGHVYVISNIGSFGEGVVKIGMTRRLDPLDRVKELGDASVPFLFDLHALIYSENAPALERQLHDKFAKERFNLVNNRKEFFKVDLESVKAALKEINSEVDFYMQPEAQEFRQTQALMNQVIEAQVEKESLFPDSI